MSHIHYNLETKIPKSFSSNYLNFSTPYEVLTSPRHSEFFSKTKSSHRPNTNGQPSVVLYRKTDKLPYKFDFHFKESGYITDGGIHKKKQRYINSQSPKHTFTSSNSKSKPLMCSKSMRSVKKQQNTNLILMTTCPSVKNISSHNKIFTSISSGMNNKHYITSPKVKTTSVISSSSNKKLTLSPSNQSNSIKHKSSKTKANKKHTHHHHPQIQTYRGLKLSQHESEEDKNDKKNFLIQRDIQQLLRDTQPSNNERRNEINRKTLILSDNGVYIKNIEQILNGETPSQSERSRLSIETVSNVNDKQQQRPTIKQIHLKNKSHKYLHTNTSSTRPMLSSPSRQVLKPKIDNFEFCHQIHLHQKIKAKSKKQKSNHKININSSFRECVNKKDKPHISGTTSSLIDSKVREVRDSENEFLFSHKKVYKSQENIQRYIKTKRKKELILEENKIQQKNKRILNNYKELYNIGNMRRFPKKKKTKHTKHKQYKYMYSNVNLSTIIDEDKLKDEVFKVQNIIYKDEDDNIMSSTNNNNNNNGVAHSNNMLSHSNSNTTTGSEQHQQDEMVNNNNNNNCIGNMKSLIKKVEDTIKQNDIVNNKAMMNQLLNSNETTSEENEQLNEEDLLTSNNNDKHRQTLHSKSEKTPRSITTSNNTHTHTNRIHTKHNTSKHSNKSKHNINIQINNNTKHDNKCTTSDIAVTKDANVPSLSHSYINNTNQNNQHIDIGIEPRCVVNLVEILKILTQRKVFFFLYELYLNEIIIYRYNIAFSYFIAVLKQNAFLAIEEYGTYKTDYYAFIKLFSPFLRRQFEFFVNQCHYRKKVEYLVEILMKRMKFSFLERIYFYGYARASRNNVIKGICKALTRPYLISAFETFMYNVNIVNRSNGYSNSNSNNCSDNYSDLLYMSLNKNNTYVYESFSSESYSIDPNSEDSPKLHTLFRMVESFAQRRGEEFDGEIDLSVLKENAKERVWKNATKIKQSEHIVSKKHNSNSSNDKEKSRFSKDKEMQIEINIEPDIDIYSNHSNIKHNFNSEQDISIDKEHSNIDWVLNVPSETKSKDNSSSSSTNEKPKLKIITEPPKESLFSTTKPTINNNLNNNNNNNIKPTHQSNLIIEEVPYDNTLSPPLSQHKHQTPPNKSLIINNNSESTCSLFADINLPSFTDAITNELISTLIEQEITKSKLIPRKHFNIQPNQNNSLQLSQSGSLTSSSLNNLNASDKLNSSPKNASNTNIAFVNPLNENLLAAYSSSSVFNRSIKEKKKEQSLTFYTHHIAPQLISLIKQEIIANYNDIITNISSPLKTNPHELITALVLEDADLLRNNYRLSQINRDISDILNKQNLLNKFAPINRAIRQQTSTKAVIASEQARDDMLNSCLIDATIELINKERKYGDAGEPLPWSSRMRDIEFKYDKAHPHKLATFIERKLYALLNDKLGMINDNYEYLSPEQVNIESEGKLIETIKNELKESELQWSNFEIQETQIKLEITDTILDQLYNEVVEILEHIQFNRKRPDLYQFKSIYACEEIPRLSFQITTTNEENENEDENDIINMEDQLH